jgi:hypothetical protein
MHLYRIGVLIVVSTVAFWFGVRVGSHQSWLLSSATDAYVSATRLKLLNVDGPEVLEEYLERELDEQIGRYGEFLRSGTPIVFWPENHDFDHAHFFSRARDYRLDNPVDSGFGRTTWGQEAYDRAMAGP